MLDGILRGVKLPTTAVSLCERERERERGGGGRERERESNVLPLQMMSV